MGKGSLAAAIAAVLVMAVAVGYSVFPRKDPPLLAEATPFPDRVDTGFVVTGPESFDSADTAILVDRNVKENTLTFLNLELGKRYTLSMDGTTRMYDKYGQSLSLEQFALGDIVDITFLRSKKHLTSMQLSLSAWSYLNVENYELNMIRRELSIGKDIYKLTENTQFLSEDRSIEMMDLNPSDVLSFQGIDSQVLTVRVDKGHGYLRLVNDENFVGGWIEIGQAQIRRITEDMLLTVPEGNYQVNISNRGGGGIKTVAINRNEETCLDIGDLVVPEPQSGMVLFSLNPSNAELYIDGEKADVSGPVTLEYGLHQLIARADGYHSVTQYIKIAQESGGFDITLDAVDQDSEESSSVSASSSTQAVTNYYKVYVDAPENAEIYLDGNYIGISPCNFRKTAGSHTITLRRTGFVTRSYMVEIDNEARDLTLSFANLVPVDAPTSSANSSSANSSSANSSN
ncbi:MAG: PEGA domain-containing protein [Lachnospiraceae bacterium]|nr:PEGA domain-containing protein [Butyrivibrio sp.]MCM1342798.1 PEGA domain-containing protein [Muribaculaceae bacterium]MCM1409938.1 PEGA domain-containing protein [Lachnospiraceae bacterium]